MPTFEELVDPKHTAVLVIDVQNDFCHPEGGQAKAGMEISEMTAVVPNIVKLTEDARAHDVPVIFIRNGHSEFTRSQAQRNKRGDNSRGGRICEEGTWGADYYLVKPLPGEREVIKFRFDAFIGTKLELLLHNMGIETVVMSGVTTNTCVETTSRHAYVADFNVVFLKDCTATHYQHEHEATLHNIDLNFGFVKSAEEVVEAWASHKQLAEPIQATVS